MVKSEQKPAGKGAQEMQLQGLVSRDKERREKQRMDPARVGAGRRTKANQPSCFWPGSVTK